MNFGTLRFLGQLGLLISICSGCAVESTETNSEGTEESAYKASDSRRLVLCNTNPLNGIAARPANDAITFGTVAVNAVFRGPDVGKTFISGQVKLNIPAEELRRLQQIRPLADFQGWANSRAELLSQAPRLTAPTAFEEGTIKLVVSDRRAPDGKGFWGTATIQVDRQALALRAPELAPQYKALADAPISFSVFCSL